MDLNSVMSKKIIVGNSFDNISKISSIMKDNDIGFLPIVSDNKIIGVITDRDIVVKVISNNDFDCDITNYISKDIISVDVNSDLLDVLAIMKKFKVKRVLVTNDKHVVGIVSISDLLNCEFSKEVFSTIRDIFEIGPNVHKYETQIDEFYL